MKETIAEARGLIKRYGEKVVVAGVNFQVHKGECFGILGPNGAGKTSTMKMMYCASPVSNGDLFVLGLHVSQHAKEIKTRIGVVPQDDGLDTDFSVLENLMLYASYYNISKTEAYRKSMELIRFMQLEEKLNSSVDKLSGGMRRRLAIARGLLNDPQVLFLDEPTTGLDPQARLLVWDNLRALKRRGVSMVLTTHYMEEAEHLCDRIVIMHEGKFLCEGTPKELVASQIGTEVVEVLFEEQDQKYFIDRVKGHYDYQVIRNRIYLFIKQGQDAREALKLWPKVDTTIRKANLNDVFLKVAGSELKD